MHRLIDFSLRNKFLVIVLTQIPLFALAMHAQGWAFFALAIAFMAFVFGAIPFTDALIVRYVDDRMRSRVAGVRIAIAVSASPARSDVIDVKNVGVRPIQSRVLPWSHSRYANTATSEVSPSKIVVASASGVPRFHALINRG